MSSIAGILLMLMPAEQAFWCLVSIMNKYLTGYFSDGLLAVQLDGKVMEKLVTDINPDIGRFLVCLFWKMEISQYFSHLLSFSFLNLRFSIFYNKSCFRENMVYNRPTTR